MAPLWAFVPLLSLPRLLCKSCSSARVRSFTFINNARCHARCLFNHNLSLPTHSPTLFSAHLRFQHIRFQPSQSAQNIPIRSLLQRLPLPNMKTAALFVLVGQLALAMATAEPAQASTRYSIPSFPCNAFYGSVSSGSDAVATALVFDGASLPN